MRTGFICYWNSASEFSTAKKNNAVVLKRITISIVANWIKANVNSNEIKFNRKSYDTTQL